MPEADTIDRVKSRRVQVASLPPADSGRGFARLPDRLMDDLVIERADGTPVYHLAVVVDDHDAGITHVVRRSFRLVGSYGGRTRTDMPALIRLIEAGAVTVDAQISTRVPLEEAGLIYEALDRGEVVGRALVLP